MLGCVFWCRTVLETVASLESWNLESVLGGGADGRVRRGMTYVPWPSHFGKLDRPTRR